MQTAIILTGTIVFIGLLFIVAIYQMLGIERKEVRILMKLNEVATILNAIDEKLTKAKGEIVAEIAGLKDALTNVELPAEAAEKLAALEASAQGLDDIVPDVTA